MLEKLQLQKYEIFKEDYFYELKDIFEIFDSYDAVNAPSNWEYLKKPVEGHNNAIVENSLISCYT